MQSDNPWLVPTPGTRDPFARYVPKSKRLQDKCRQLEGLATLALQICEATDPVQVPQNSLLDHETERLRGISNSYNSRTRSPSASVTTANPNQPQQSHTKEITQQDTRQEETKQIDPRIRWLASLRPGHIVTTLSWRTGRVLFTGVLPEAIQNGIKRQFIEFAPLAEREVFASIISPSLSRRFVLFALFEKNDDVEGPIVSLSLRNLSKNTDAALDGAQTNQNNSINSGDAAKNNVHASIINKLKSVAVVRPPMFGTSVALALANQAVTTQPGAQLPPQHQQQHQQQQHHALVRTLSSRTRRTGQDGSSSSSSLSVSSSSSPLLSKLPFSTSAVASNTVPSSHYSSHPLLESHSQSQLHGRQTHSSIVAGPIGPPPAAADGLVRSMLSVSKRGLKQRIIEFPLLSSAPAVRAALLALLELARTHPHHAATVPPNRFVLAVASSIRVPEAVTDAVTEQSQCVTDKYGNDDNQKRSSSVAGVLTPRQEIGAVGGSSDNNGNINNNIINTGSNPTSSSSSSSSTPALTLPAPTPTTTTSTSPFSPSRFTSRSTAQEPPLLHVSQRASHLLPIKLPRSSSSRRTHHSKHASMSSNEGVGGGGGDAAAFFADDAVVDCAQRSNCFHSQQQQQQKQQLPQQQHYRRRRRRRLEDILQSASMIRAEVDRRAALADAVISSGGYKGADALGGSMPGAGDSTAAMGGAAASAGGSGGIGGGGLGLGIGGGMMGGGYVPHWSAEDRARALPKLRSNIDQPSLSNAVSLEDIHGGGSVGGGGGTSRTTARKAKTAKTRNGESKSTGNSAGANRRTNSAATASAHSSLMSSASSLSSSPRKGGDYLGPTRSFDAQLRSSSSAQAHDLDLSLEHLATAPITAEASRVTERLTRLDHSHELTKLARQFNVRIRSVEKERHDLLRRRYLIPQSDDGLMHTSEEVAFNAIAETGDDQLITQDKLEDLAALSRKLNSATDAYLLNLPRRFL